MRSGRPRFRAALPPRLGLGLLLLVPACGTPRPAPPDMPIEDLRIPAFELEDQEGRIHRYEGRSDRPAVIMVTCQEGVESNKAWDRWLTSRYGESLLLYRVVDLSGVPGLFRSIAKSRVREGADPPGIPILLDWEGWFASLLPLSKEASTMILADREGRASLVLRGTPDEERRSELARKINALMERGNER